MNEYGFTARHVQCDHCLCRYEPQHVQRVARWAWACYSCCWRHWGGRVLVEPDARLRYRYAKVPHMLLALRLRQPS